MYNTYTVRNMYTQCSECLSYYCYYNIITTAILVLHCYTYTRVIILCVYTTLSSKNSISTYTYMYININYTIAKSIDTAHDFRLRIHDKSLFFFS